VNYDTSATDKFSIKKEATVLLIALVTLSRLIFHACAQLLFDGLSSSPFHWLLVFPFGEARGGFESFDQFEGSFLRHLRSIVARKSTPHVPSIASSQHRLEYFFRDFLDLSQAFNFCLHFLETFSHFIYNNFLSLTVKTVNRFTIANLQ
jgi:hypothetical protein